MICCPMAPKKPIIPILGTSNFFGKMERFVLGVGQQTVPITLPHFFIVITEFLGCIHHHLLRAQPPLWSWNLITDNRLCLRNKSKSRLSTPVQGIWANFNFFAWDNNPSLKPPNRTSASGKIIYQSIFIIASWGN